MKNYNDLKNSIFNMVVYIDCDKHINTEYFVNIKQNTIRKLLQNENYIIVCIRSLTFEEYINNNLYFNNIEQIDNKNLFDVEFWQKSILYYNDILLDKMYNAKFVTYQLAADEIKHIYKLKTYNDNGICEYFTYKDWNKVQKYF